MVAESPSPIATPDIMAASWIPAIRKPAISKTNAAIRISVDATAVAVQSRVLSQADEHMPHGMANGGHGAHELSEAAADQTLRGFDEAERSSKKPCSKILHLKTSYLQTPLQHCHFAPRRPVIPFT